MRLCKKAKDNLVSRGIALVLWLMGPVCFCLLLMQWAEPALGASGYWQYVRLEELRVGPQYPTVTRAGTAGKVTISKTVVNHHIDDSPYHADQTISGVFEWSAAPLFLVPGKLLTYPLKGTVLINSHRNRYLHLSLGAWIRWGDSGSSYFVDRRDNKEYEHLGLSVFDGISSGSVLNISTGSILLKGVREIPAGAPENPRASITVGIQCGNDLVEYRYHYAWKDGPVPATQTTTSTDSSQSQGEEGVSGTSQGSSPGSGSSSSVQSSGQPGQPASSGQVSVKEPADVKGMSLQAGKRTVKSGDTVTVPVYLIKGAGVGDMNFNVTYNTSVAQAVQAVRGSLIPVATLFEASTGQGGNVRMGFAGITDFGGTGPVAQLTFRAVGKPGSRTPLRVVVTIISSASGGNPSIATIDGEIEIVDGTSATTTSPTTTIPTTTTTTTLPPKETRGDCDGNGTLNTLDARCALKMSVGLITVNMRTDMDSDGRVTSTDARLIMQKAMGK